MEIGAEIREEEKDFKKVINMFRKRNFKGDTGQAVKNSSYQLATNLIMKVGSLLFVFIIARLLQPERMGLYNLALSTILLFSIFSDLGIGSALITYLSKMLGKNNPERAKGYAKKLFHWKVRLVGFSSLVLLGGAYFISEYYYQKPIFYAVLAGALYLPAMQFLGFIEGMFRAENNFKTPMKKEIIIQITRLTLVPLSIFLLIKSGISDKILIMLVILSITACQLIALLFLGIKSKTEIPFLKVRAKDLDEKEKKDLKKFIYPLSATAMAGMFFGYIDTLMLGRYVASEYIAFYGAAFALIGSAGAIIGFMAAAMMPIFSREKGQQLEKMFRKTRNFTLIISIAAAIFTYFTAWWIIRLAYGTGYLTAVPILRWFSVLLIFTTLIGLYSSYFISQKRTKIVSGLLIGSTLLNIIMNIIGITYGINHYGPMGGVYGAVIATIASRVVYLLGFVLWKAKK
jgi:O-antigen/teichoic acid export membrane protein